MTATPFNIPFAEGQASGLSQVSGAAPLLINLLPDPANSLRVWPGIGTWSDFPTVVPNASPVIGMYSWRDYIIYVTLDRKIWAWLGPNNVLALSDATATTQLDGTGRPSFTFDQQRVVIAGGGEPQKWEGAGLSARLAPGATKPDGSPLALTHIAYAAQTLIGNLNDNSGIVQWSEPGPGGHATWPIVGPFYAEAETAPDPVIALFANANEVFAFGEATTQVYQPDATIYFSPGPSLGIGCAAAFSVILIDDGAFAWLDNSRRIVLSDGRGFDVISTPGMTADFKSLTTVSDCWGAAIVIGPFDLLVWVFPTEGRAFWYDRITKKWGERSSCNASTGNFEAWLAQSHMYWPSQNKHLVGLSDGRIGTLDFTNRTDDGRMINGISRTGFQDNGTFVRKLCQRIQVQVVRSYPTGSTDPAFELRYRDTLGSWSPTITASLASSDYQTVVDMGWALGDFRARQYELRFSNAAEFVMTGAVAQIETLDS